MKVKDIINAKHDMVGIEIKTVVKPMGTSKNYYDSENSNHLNNEIAEMEVKFFSLFPTKKNKCDFVIIVERNEKYEADREKAWKDLLSK